MLFDKKKRHELDLPGDGCKYAFKKIRDLSLVNGAKIRRDVETTAVLVTR